MKFTIFPDRDGWYVSACDDTLPRGKRVLASLTTADKAKAEAFLAALRAKYPNPPVKVSMSVCMF